MLGRGLFLCLEHPISCWVLVLDANVCSIAAGESAPGAHMEPVHEAGAGLCSIPHPNELLVLCSLTITGLLWFFTALTVRFITRRFIGDYDPTLGR